MLLTTLPRLYPGVVTLVAHAGDVQLYLLVPGVVFFVAYRLARGPVSKEQKQTSRGRTQGG
jgi:hypothetical protein